jgi:uncharacterized protein YqeY
MSSELKARLQADLIEARKSRDKLRTLVLSTTLSDLRNREIELGTDADDDVVADVVAKAIKRRKDAADQMSAAGRTELADKESVEAEMLQSYLPEGLTEDEVRAIIREVMAGGVRQFGPVMGAVMGRIRGRFDGKDANRLVREELGTGSS